MFTSLGTGRRPRRATAPVNLHGNDLRGEIHLVAIVLRLQLALRHGLFPINGKSTECLALTTSRNRGDEFYCFTARLRVTSGQPLPRRVLERVAVRRAVIPQMVAM